MKAEKSWNPSDARRLDALCDRFEDAWKGALAGGARPVLSEFLQDFPTALHGELVSELLGVELHYRRQMGESPSSEDYSQTLDITLGSLDIAELLPSSANPATETPNVASSLREVDATQAQHPQRRGVPTKLPQVEGYDVLGILGRGGMGVVYKARHLRLNRVVAMKMILAQAHAGPDERARFLGEAEAVAALHHPHIVQLLEFGQHDDLPFFTLEFVPGGTLASQWGGKPQHPSVVAAMVEKLARAMDYAHRKGLVHRDLKPANVLIDEESTPRITDFGLARRLDSNEGVTATGAVLGTPSYMSPEQARGETRSLGPRCDIYALGAILYEGLTGRPPYRGDSMLATMRQILDGDPPSLQSLRPGIPLDLATICQKCMRREPAQRYETAEELAEDLRRFQAGEPILARPVGKAERLWRWCKRNPAVASLVAMVLALLVTGVIVASYFAWHAEEQRQLAVQAKEAESKRADAEQTAKKAAEIAGLKEAAAREEMQRQVVDLYATTGLQAANRGEHSEAFLWFTEAALRAKGDAERERLNRIRVNSWGKYVGEPIRALVPPGFQSAKEGFRILEFHPTGRYLLAVTTKDVCRVWDLETSMLLDLPTEGPIRAAAWSPNGDLAVAHFSSGIDVYRLSDLRRIEIIPTAGPVFSVSYCPRGRLLAWGGTRSAGLWDCRDKHAVATWRHPGTVINLAFNADGSQVVTTSANKARVFSAETAWKAPIFAAVPHECGNLGLAHKGPWAPLFLPSNKGLVTVTARDKLVWRDATTGMVLHTLSPPPAAHSLVGASVSPDGRCLAAVWQNFGRLWDIKEGKELCIFEHEHQHAEDVQFDPTGQTMLTVGQNTIARFWDLRRLHPGRAVPESAYPLRHANQVVLARFSPVGSMLATAQSDGQITIWRLPGGPSPQYVVNTNGFTRIAASPDKKQFLPCGLTYVNASLTSTAVYESETGLPAGPFFHPDGIILDGIFSGDGQKVFLACTTSSQTNRNKLMFAPEGKAGNIQCWNWKTGERIGPLIPMPSEPRGLALSPDGALLAVVCAGGPVFLLDTSDGHVVRQMGGPARGPSFPNLWWSNGSACFNGDGSRLATWEMSPSVKIWEVASGRLLHTLKHSDRIHEASFAGDGATLITACRDNLARVWDTRTGNLLATPLSHPQGVVRARLEKDQRTLATLCDDKMVRRWDWNTGEIVSSFKLNQIVPQALECDTESRFALCGALSGLAAVDRDSETLLAPELNGSNTSQIVALHSSPLKKRVASAGLEWFLVGYDLDGLLTPADDDSETLKRKAELASGLRIDAAGRLVPLTSNQWRKHATDLWAKKLPELPIPHVSPATQEKCLLHDELKDKSVPSDGAVIEAQQLHFKEGEEGVELRKASRITYSIERFPAESYTLSFKLKVRDLRLCAPFALISTHLNPIHEPLRVEIEEGRLIAKSGIGQSYVTGRVPLPEDAWLDVAIVKRGSTLSVLVDGQLRATALAPKALVSDVQHLYLSASGLPVLASTEVRISEVRLVSESP